MKGKKIGLVMKLLAANEMQPRKYICKYFFQGHLVGEMTVVRPSVTTSVFFPSVTTVFVLKVLYIYHIKPCSTDHPTTGIFITRSGPA